MLQLKLCSVSDDNNQNNYINPTNQINQSLSTEEMKIIELKIKEPNIYYKPQKLDLKRGLIFMLHNKI